MARPRTPTKVLRMRGAFKKNPARERARAHEPEVTDPLGDPPDCLDEAQQARWRDLADMAPWLTVADRAIVEQTARLWVLERNGLASLGQMRLLSSNLGSLGLRPSDRSKVRMPDAGSAKTKASKYLTA